MAILKVKGSWPISNLKGWIKKFKDVESDDAIVWMSNRDFEPAEMTKEDKAAYKAQQKAEKLAVAEALKQS